MRMTPMVRYIASPAIVLLGVILLLPTISSAQTVSVDHPIYLNPATVLATKDAGSQVSLYFMMGATPIANTSGSIGAWTNQSLNAFSWSAGSFAGTVNGQYQLVVATNASCAALSYSACIAANPAAYAEALFEITNTLPPTPNTNATSTVDQTQANLFYGFILFTCWVLVFMFILIPRRQ